MSPELVLVRLGELTLKGRNRRRFERTVLGQIRRVLKFAPHLEYELEYGRIIITLNGSDYSQLVQPLKKVFGVISFSPIYKEELNPELIAQKAVQLLAHNPDIETTFKAEVKRVNKQFELDTPALSRLIGGHLLRAYSGLKVDVHNPDLMVRVEIREEYALLYCETEEGAGGFPLGSNGKAVLMLSGGIDSPVAGYLAMRQGLELEAVHFHSYPYTSERAQEKVKELAGKLSAYCGSLKLHMVPLTELQTSLNQAYQGSLYVTLLRRAMMRIAGAVAEARGAGAIVTGESLGQVASQTLPSMQAIGSVMSLPAIRPLICMEKREIIELARRIDTYNLSIQPHEDCCTLFLPPNPSTNPNLRMAQRIEQQLPWLSEAEAKAVAGAVTIVVDNARQAEDELSAFF